MGDHATGADATDTIGRLTRNETETNPVLQVFPHF